MRTFVKGETVWQTHDEVTARALLESGYVEQVAKVKDEPAEEKPKKKAVKGE